MSDADTDLITTTEVARLLGVHPTTITRWAENGLIDSVTLPSGRRRYHRSTIQGMVDRLAAMVTELDADITPLDPLAPAVDPPVPGRGESTNPTLIGVPVAADVPDISSLAAGKYQVHEPGDYKGVNVDDIVPVGRIRASSLTAVPPQQPAPAVPKALARALAPADLPLPAEHWRFRTGSVEAYYPDASGPYVTIDDDGEVWHGGPCRYAPDQAARLEWLSARLAEAAAELRARQDGKR